MAHVSRGGKVLAARVMYDPRYDDPVLTEDMIRYANFPARPYVHDALAELAAEGVDEDDPTLLAQALDRAEQYVERTFGVVPAQYRPEQSLFAPDRSLHRPVVYYMRMSGLVKIGWSGSIKSRTETLMTQGVMAVEWGERPEEAARHRQFINLHSHGEWFYLDETLAAHIVERRAAFEATEGMTVEEWLSQQGVRQ